MHVDGLACTYFITPPRYVFNVEPSKLSTFIVASMWMENNTEFGMPRISLVAGRRPFSLQGRVSSPSSAHRRYRCRRRLRPPLLLLPFLTLSTHLTAPSPLPPPSRLPVCAAGLGHTFRHGARCLFLRPAAGTPTERPSRAPRPGCWKNPPPASIPGLPLPLLPPHPRRRCWSSLDVHCPWAARRRRRAPRPHWRRSRTHLVAAGGGARV